MPLDRASTERKDPAHVTRLLADPRARALIATVDSVALDDREPTSLRRAPAVPVPAEEAILLGLENGIPLFALDLDAIDQADRAGFIEGSRVVALRDAASTLSHGEAGLAAYLSGLLNWHRKHRFCANCGAPTSIEEAGHSRRCPRCGAHHFPRTDPVVIMTVEYAGHLLLGRRAGWPAHRCSVLAGFISPGESAEEAVVREVQEESGIVCRDPEFVASQPWPFPSSLMLGFEARSDGGEPRARDGELAEVHWVPFDAVRQAVQERNPELQLPPPISIARFLIERWVASHDTGAGR